MIREENCVKSKTILLYEGRGDVSLTTYVLQDSPELLAGKRRPAILICPGGGYFNCSDREAEPIALRFAAMGYHALAASPICPSPCRSGSGICTPRRCGTSARPCA